MTAVPFADVQGLAGGFSLGAVRAGFELVARKSLVGGFGDKVIAANRHLIGVGWEQQTGLQDRWDPVHDVGFICGTPPCSGFSLLNTTKGSNSRGPDSDINNCMWDLIRFAGRCTGLDGGLGPEVVSFESVQGAFKQGRSLMKALRAELEARTGTRYDLTHVKMSGASVGSAQMRHRYYFVAHRVSFHIENPERRRVITYRDAIGDLEGLDIRIDDQPLNLANASEWSQELHRDDGLVDWHLTPTGGSAFVRLVDELAQYWEPGERIDEAVRKMYLTEGRIPSVIKPHKFLGIDGKQVLDGWSWPTRIRPDRPGYVLTGAGILSFVHYSEDRMLTVRECSRLMGYPDAWSWATAASPMQASMMIGKCAPVQSCRWISEYVQDAITAHYHSTDFGSPPTATGDVQEIGEREWLHDSTNLYRQWLKEDELVATA